MAILPRGMEGEGDAGAAPPTRTMVRLMTFGGHLHPSAYAGQDGDSDGGSRSVDSQQKRRRTRWVPPQRDSLTRREQPEKMGVRRRRRYDNDHFTEHPDMLLATEDVPVPGYPENVPRIHFSRVATAMAAATDMPATKTSGVAGKAGSSCCQRAPGDRTLRQAVRRRNVSQGLVRRIEADVMRFIAETEPTPELSDDEWSLVDEEMVEEAEEQQQSQQDLSASVVLVADKPATADNTKRLVLDASTDGVSRLVLHSICRYYGLRSYSQESRHGRRITFVERLEDTPPIHPDRCSFFDTLFASIAA